MHNQTLSSITTSSILVHMKSILTMGSWEVANEGIWIINIEDLKGGSMKSLGIHEVLWKVKFHQNIQNALTANCEIPMVSLVKM